MELGLSKLLSSYIIIYNVMVFIQSTSQDRCHGQDIETSSISKIICLYTSKRNSFCFTLFVNKNNFIRK